MTDIHPPTPSLLTKTELEWLLGNTSMSKSFEYKIKSTIKKKIDKFVNFELPLLIQNQMLDKQLTRDILDNPNNMLPILGKEKVAGSNPAQGYESSLRVHSNEYEEKNVQHFSPLYSVSNGNKHQINSIKSPFEMRDLYCRKQRLESWTERIHKDLVGTDKNDLLKFLEIMEEKDQAILTIVKGISIMLQLRKQFNKPFCQVTKDDMKLLFKWMNNKGYRVETHEKIRAVLKKFFKMVYGNNESYPECVKWFTVKVGKDKKSQERQLEPIPKLSSCK